MIKTFLPLAIISAILSGLIAFSVTKSTRNLGAPATFIGPVATSTKESDIGFTIGTTTPQGQFGTSTLSVYGSTTIQTRINTIHALEVFNAASSSIFNVNTVGGLINVSGTGTSTASGGWNITAGCFAISGTCVGGPSGSGVANELAYWSSGTVLTSNSAFAVNSGLSRLTVTNLVSTNSTSTNATSTEIQVSGGFTLNAERFTDLTGAGLAFSTGLLGIGTGGVTNAMLATSPTNEFTYTVGGPNLTTWSYLTPTSTAVGLLVPFTASSTLANLTIVAATSTRATSSYLAITSFASSSQILVDNGLGVGTATTTNGVIQTTGVVNIGGTGTSTFTRGINLTGGCIRYGTATTTTEGGYCVSLEDEASSIYASSTLDYDGDFSTTGTTTYVLANYRGAFDLISMYCSTNKGTMTVQIGTGTASSTARCTTSGVESNTRVYFAPRANYMISIGNQSASADIVTVTDTRVSR